MTQAITSAPAPIQALPPEIFQGQIIVEREILDFTDICNLQKVCRLFHECLQQDFIWKHYLKRDFPLQGLQEGALEVYRRAHLLRSNVINGVFQKSKFGRDHFHSHPTLSVANDQLISWATRSMIKIWDLKTKEGYSIPFEGTYALGGQLYPERNVTGIVTGDDQFLFLGFNDATIKVYDLKIRKFVLSSNVHGQFGDCPIISMAYSTKKLFVGLTDETIRVLDWSAVKNELKEINKLKALNSNFNLELAVSGNTLISIGSYETFQFWDLTTYECRHTFNYPTFYSFALADKKCIIGLKNGDVEIISTEDGTVLHQLFAHPNRVESLVAIEGIFFSEDRDERRFWDLATGKPLGAMPRGLQPATYNAYSKGTLFYVDHLHDIWEVDYLGDDDEILADIAEDFRANAGLYRAHQKVYWDALKHFNRMPKYAREQIYPKFVHFNPRKLSPHELFNDLNVSTVEKRAEAIEAYLAERRKEEVKK